MSRVLGILIADIMFKTMYVVHIRMKSNKPTKMQCHFFSRCQFQNRHLCFLNISIKDEFEIEIFGLMCTMHMSLLILFLKTLHIFRLCHFFF